MNATAHEFSGLTTKTVAEIVGPEAAKLLIQIDHAHMEYGINWRWVHGRQVFTAEGLELIATELAARGYTGAAEQLRTATRYAMAAEAPAPAKPVTDADLVGHRDWLGRWEEEHGQ